ncbi:DUF4352 domain-containing protein [Nonomuraea rubra]
MGYPSDPHRQQEAAAFAPPPHDPYGPGHQYTAGPDHLAGPPYGYGPPTPPTRPRRRLALVLALAIGVPVVLLGGSATAWFVLVEPVRDSISSASASPADPPASAEQPAEPAAPPSDEPSEGTASKGDDGDPLTSRPGGTVTLAGMESGSKMAVTLNEVYHDAAPTADSAQPRPGNRLAAVQLTLTNKGRVVYSDAPMNGAVMIDSGSQQYPFSISRVEQGLPFHWMTSIKPGDSLKGTVVFEVPEDAELVRFQFALNSGYAQQRGEWALR